MTMPSYLLPLCSSKAAACSTILRKGSIIAVTSAEGEGF
jgi:hypothetical protein